MSEEQRGRAGPCLHLDTVEVPALIPHQDMVSSQTEHRTARLAEQVVLTDETERKRTKSVMLGLAADQVLPEVWQCEDTHLFSLITDSQQSPAW